MRFFVTILVIFLLTIPTFARVEYTCENYLKNKRHFAIANPVAENLVEKVLKKSIKREIGEGKYKVKFQGYTLSSMRKGVFKYLEIIGKNLEIESIPVKYLNLKTETDYNWIEYDKKPIIFKSDMVFSYHLELTEDSINSAFKHKSFQAQLDKINKRAYPLFTLKDVTVRIRNNKLYVIMEYDLPLSSSKKKRTFMASSNFKVVNGKIKATNVHIDKSYGNIPLDKVTNLINLIDPLTFTLKVLNDNNCQTRVENVKIDDNIIQINGRIDVKKTKSN
ncbi:hypothetical protein IJ384_05850 [bacterium]|nr:hypothetical protein [bacterium]